MTGNATGGAAALRVLLVDDHPIVRRGLCNIVADAYHGAAIREVGSASEAIAAGLDEPWDIVILDLSLPDGSGLDVLKRLRDERPRMPILILSMHGVEQFARRAIHAGATGYLTKDTADTELVTAMGQLLRGGQYFGSDLLESVMLADPRGSEDRPHERLSDREYQVLRMIGSGQTVSEIAATLGLSVKTISTYRARVLEKMHMRTNAELTRYAVERDLVD